MNIDLAILREDAIMLVSDEPLPSIVRRVEYYRDQKLLMLVYNDPQYPEELMQYEIPEGMTRKIENCPNMIIFSVYPDHKPIGYKAPLVQIID